MIVYTRYCLIQYVWVVQEDGIAVEKSGVNVSVHIQDGIAVVQESQILSAPLQMLLAGC